MRRFYLSVLTAWALGVGSTAWANGVVRDGMGAISIGRGATNLAFADNGAIILDNPAGMSNVRGNGLTDLGVDTVFCDIGYVDPDNSIDGEVRPFPAGMFGYIKHIDDTPWSVGIGVFAPAGFGADFDMNNPDTGLVRQKSLGMLGKLLPALSCQVTDRLSVGAGLGLALCHAELEGPFYTQTGPNTGAPSFFDLQATGAAVTGNVGMQYVVSDRTVIGIAYTEQTKFDFDGSAGVRFPGLGNLESGFDAQTGITWPRSLGAGIMHEVFCCHRIGFDVVWYDWSSAFDQMDISLTNPDNALLGGMQIQDVFPMNWRDSVSYRFGYEWDVTQRLTWRLGYVYHRSPAPDATLNPYLDGVLEHVYSMGFGYQFKKATLNIAYQYGHSPERHVGTSSLAGGDYDNSTLQADAHWAAFSLLVPF